MAEKDMMVSPLYSTGVGHAEVNAPMPADPPDKMGIFSANRPSASWSNSGSGPKPEWSEKAPKD